MTKAQQLYKTLMNRTFSYGESVSMILEHQGKPISTLPNEDFLFSDNSVIRVTNNSVQLLEFLQE